MFTNAAAYERYMGRWSQRLAPLLVAFAQVADGERLLDVGAGTGSLALALSAAAPASAIVGVEPSAPYVAYARTRTSNPRLRFAVGDAQALPFPAASFDHCLSLLVVNFIPDARRAAQEMRRVTRPGGRVSACVWDYSDGMTMLRRFWDTAVALDPAAEPRHEGHMPHCRAGQLAALWRESGLRQIEETGLVIDTDFGSFEDFWAPFLDGQAPAPNYATALPPERQAALRERLRATLLGDRPDGPFALTARAWAVRGTV